MRRRIQAVARGQGRCDCGPIGVRLSRNGRPGAAVGYDGGASSVYDRIKGPFHQRLSRAIGASTTIDTFQVFMYGFQDGDSVLWVAPSTYEGTEEAFSGTVTIANPESYVTTVTLEYANILAASVANIACIVNGAILIGCVEIGSIYGGDYP